MTVKLSPSTDQPTLIFDRPILVLVEGPDDRAFVARQVLEVSNGQDWHVHYVTGKGADWVDLIELALDSPQFSSVGRAIAVVLDADRDAAAAADKASSVFRRARIPVPSTHGEIASGMIKTGFFVMPDGASTGALEELLLLSVDEDRLTLASDYIQTVSTQLEPPRNAQKAVLQAFLAGQKEHLKTVPVAVHKKDVFPSSHASFESFRTFLSALATT